MEIIIGYVLGAIVVFLFITSLFKMAASRIKNDDPELKDKVEQLEKRVKNLESK